MHKLLLFCLVFSVAGFNQRHASQSVQRKGEEASTETEESKHSVWVNGTLWESSEEPPKAYYILAENETHRLETHEALSMMEQPIEPLVEEVKPLFSTTSGSRRRRRRRRRRISRRRRRRSGPRTPAPTPPPTPPAPKPAPKVGKYTWVRFTCTKVRGPGEMQIADIKFRANGQDIKLVEASGGLNPTGREGPQKAIDGNCRTKFLDSGGWKQGSKFGLAVRFDGKYAVDEMQLVTANDVERRDPMRFTVEGSDDQASWTLIYKSKKDENIPKRRFAETEWFELVKLDDVIKDNEQEQEKDAKKEEKEREVLVPTPTPLKPTPKPNLDPVSGDKYKFIRFSPLATRGAGIMQVAEVHLKCMNHGGNGHVLKVINAESGGDRDGGPEEGPKHCIDGQISTKWLAHDKGLKGIILELETAHTVTAIEIVTGNDAPARDPVKFKVEGSNVNTNDQSKWTLLYQSHFNEVIPVDRGQHITIEFKEPKKCSSNDQCESKECKGGKCTPPVPKVFCGGKEGWSEGGNGKCYKFLKHEPARVKFDTARSLCQAAGGDLDTINNEKDTQVHYDKCRYGKEGNGYTHYRTCWLGYTDRAKEGNGGIRDVINNQPRKFVPKYMDWNNWNRADRDCPTLSRQKMG